MKVARTQLLTAALMSAVLAAGCSGGPEANESPKAERKVVLVKVERVTQRVFSQKLTLTGSALADREVDVAPETMGRVAGIGFEKGRGVKAGAAMVRLDDATTRARLDQARADRELAALDYKKLSALAEMNADVSEFELDKARISLDAAVARLKALDVELDKLTIRAPISGLVVNRAVEVGAIVSPGQPLARIVSVKPIKTRTGIPETAIADFSIGKRATIVFDAFPDRIYEGAITYLSPEVDRNARIFDCELELPNGDMAILPEMSAKVTFVRKTLEDSVLIQQTSIVEMADGHAVFVVEEGSVARLRRVEIGDVSEEMALVSSGLEAGDTLVTLGQRDLIDGDLVEISD